MAEAVTVTISACGLIVVIGGKVSLGRSFGLMPANRGVVSTGLYRLVRHPIYMGYLITHVGFVAANPTIWNLMTLVAPTSRCSPAPSARRGRSRSTPPTAPTSSRFAGASCRGSFKTTASASTPNAFGWRVRWSCTGDQEIRSFFVFYK